MTEASRNAPSSPPDFQDSAPLLRLMFDDSGEGVCVFDAHLRLTAWNDRFLGASRLQAGQLRVGLGLLALMQLLARSGEFGSHDPEGEAQRCFLALRDERPSALHHLRPDGRIIEMRRSFTADGGMVLLYADVTERRATEAAMADNQRMLTLLLERTQQGFWFIDNALRTTDANPAMCRMLGLTLDRLLGRNIFEFVDEANAEIFRRQTVLRAQGHTGGYEITLRRADGSPVHCFNNATPTFDAAGRKIGAVGMFSDISAQKRAEQQIRQTGELLAQKSRALEVTLQSLSQGVLSIDAQGHITTWNHRCLELLEIPESLMQGRPTLQDITRYQVEHGQFGPHLSAMAEPGREGLRRFLGGDSQSLAARYQRTRRDGVVLDVQTHFADDGSVVRTYTDVTASVQAQQALRESESRFRTMADAAPALIWQSGADARPIWFNQRWLQYTGRDMAAELAATWTERMHPEDYLRCRVAFDAAAAAHVAYDIEFRLKRADGGWGWIVDNGIPRFSSEGRFEGFIGYGWEITERKAAEAALIAAKDEAERASRAKSEFLSRMSHELRTPLNAVLGFAQLLESDRQDPLSPAQRGRVQELMRGGRHLLSLINEVLDLASIEAGTLHLHLAPVDLAELVGDCLRLVQPMAADRRIRLQVRPAGAPAKLVQADPTRLKQVLLNLLSNAIKYNREGGSVELAWQVDPELPQATRIEVRDSGPGLTSAQCERLFQAFERLDAERSAVEGTGIGLALSKWLVDLMRGQIGVHSTLGVGSTFWVRLMQAEAVAGPSPPPPAAVAPVVSHAVTAPAPLLPPAGRSTRTVLYIEDNPVNQVLMEGMLAQRPGIRLLIAGLPGVGLAMAAQARPDLVLLDIQLPEMDGFEVMRRLRASPHTWDIPVVAVSANAMHADLERAEQAGFVDYVVKPLDMQRLLSVVDRLLAEDPDE
ncbi:PAS-domain containing protein [Aquabacterium sp.]|uniref:PAS-domain containing protein n=1 Tax=Aquabacterium sp. TaxID=1872578 RepID=UPI0037838BB9